MTVVDWSDKHKIAALVSRIKIMTRNAAEREAVIARQARTIAELFCKLQRIDALVGEAMTLCVAPERKQDHQQEGTTP
jgi:hypothetical protein